MQINGLAIVCTRARLTLLRLKACVWVSSSVFDLVSLYPRTYVARQIWLIDCGQRMDYLCAPSSLGKKWLLSIKACSRLEFPFLSECTEKLTNWSGRCVQLWWQRGNVDCIILILNFASNVCPSKFRSGRGTSFIDVRLFLSLWQELDSSRVGNAYN